MTYISKDLSQSPILVISSKREKAVAIAQFLKQSNYPTLIAGNIYEGLHLTAQEMPHLIIADGFLSDGHVGHLHDRLQYHASLRKTPVFVHIPQNTREQLESVRGRNFAGVFIGELQKQTLLQKIAEILVDSSPFFFAEENLPIRGQISLLLHGKVLARTRLLLIANTEMEINPDAQLSCMRDSIQGEAVKLRAALGIRHKKQWFNLFPIHRSEGAGRQWLSMVPLLKIPEEGPVSVLYCDKDTQEAGELAKILRGYDVIIDVAVSAADATNKLNSGAYNCILIGVKEHEEFAQFIENEGKIPTFVCSTNNRSSGGWGKMLRYPFGLGMILDKLLASRFTGDSIANALELIGANGIPVLLRAKARLLGLDETGGVLQLDFPLTPGSKVDLENDFLQKLWNGEKTVMVSSLAKVPGGWQLRFAAIAKGTSKSIYWNRVAKHIEEG